MTKNDFGGFLKESNFFYTPQKLNNSEIQFLISTDEAMSGLAELAFENEVSDWRISVRDVYIQFGRNYSKATTIKRNKTIEFIIKNT